jgi:NADPH:quinone reductase-like Zn-dependent oxidoreductase
MGMGNYGSMGTMVMADNDLLWNVPEHWTLEEAATIPVVYGTVSSHRLFQHEGSIPSRYQVLNDI